MLVSGAVLFDQEHISFPKCQIPLGEAGISDMLAHHLYGQDATQERRLLVRFFFFYMSEFLLDRDRDIVEGME